MFDFVLTLQDSLSSNTVKSDDFDYMSMPLHQFKWLVILSALALHGIIAVILTELMGRTYGKSMLWFAIAFFLPLVGSVSIWIYHMMLSTSVTDARKQTFWTRLLQGGPISLSRILLKEQAMAQEVVLSEYKTVTNNRRTNGKDPEIDSLIDDGKYGEARALAWQMMEVARETRDKQTTEKYQDYLEHIAQHESDNAGREPGRQTGADFDIK